MKKYTLMTLVAIPLLVACSASESGVSRLLPTDDTRFVSSARPIRPPPRDQCRELHKKPADKSFCRRQHWFRWRVENVGEESAFALCHLQAFAHNSALTPSRLWLPFNGMNWIKGGHVATEVGMTPFKTNRRVTRYALRCHAAMWTNGPPV
jgi:hypothetical protein